MEMPACLDLHLAPRCYCFSEIFSIYDEAILWDWPGLWPLFTSRSDREKQKELF